MVDSDGRGGGAGPSNLPDDEEGEEDWFGEGSAFDSGEDLAAALYSLAGVPITPMVTTGYDEANTTYETARPAGAAGATITFDTEAFQVLDRPSVASAASAASTPPSPTAWSVRPQIPGTNRTSWSMRHSVQFIKTTEEVIKKLRTEAIELTWQAAELAMQQDLPRRIRKR